MYKIYNQDVRQRLDDIGMFHAVLCDPPYELGFMGKGWDRSGVSFKAETWALISEYMHPGAHLFAFGGTRTFHRLVCAVEDAGLEIRDCKCYVYGSGFAKGLNVSKAIDKAAGAEREVVGIAKRSQNGVSDGWDRPWKQKQRNDSNFEYPITAPATDAAKTWAGYGTGLKPAWEPICVARKPLIGTVAENVLAYGCGALNVDGCRVACDGESPTGSGKKSKGVWDLHSGSEYQGHYNFMPASGRWPANLLHDGSEEVVRMFPETASGDLLKHHKRKGGKPPIGTFEIRDRTGEKEFIGDSGSAARFFYQVDARIDAADPIWYDAKASSSERNAGLYSFPMQELRAYGDFKGTAEHAPKMNVKARNNHPTVKPIDLCRYLAMLMLPPKEYSPRRLLVPFSGSGSEMIGALLAGWDEVVGIEMDEHYCEIAEKRIVHYTRQNTLDFF